MRFSALSGPQAYERYYVPRIFVPWGQRLLDRLTVRTGERVLDVATGPGTVARIAAERVGATGRVVGVDLSPEMLRLAREKPAVGVPIEYLEAPADALPVDDHGFDVVTCQQSLQFFPDVAAALREMDRVLAPAGRVGVAVWGPLARCEHFAAIDSAIEDAAMPDSWHEGMRAPFGRFEPHALAALLAHAGFQDILIETHVLPLRFEAGIEQALESLAVTPLAKPLDQQPGPDRDRFLTAIRRRLEPFVTRAGVVTSLCALFALGRVLEQPASPRE